MPKTSYIRVFYNTIAWFYPVIRFFLKQGNLTIIQTFNRDPQHHVLEIGVGNGAHLSALKIPHYTGIDLSEKMLALAKQNNPDRANSLFQMNGEKLEFNDSSFDTVLLSHVLSVTENPEQLIKEAYRVIKPEGNLYIVNHESPRGIVGKIDKIFSPFSSLFMFKSFFKISDVKALKRFTFVAEKSVAMKGYIKLAIYKKR